MISFWIPVVVITRSFLVDTVRSVAFAEGKTAFGSKSMMKSSISRALTASPVSRTTYAVSKALVFCWLGLVLALQKGNAAGIVSIPQRAMSTMNTTGMVIVGVVVFFCVVRGLPVLWDGKDYVLDKRYPKDIKNDR